jgi:3-dehydroquinate synthase
VLIGADFLRSLPERERRSALGEVVKYAMIADAPLFRELERRPQAWRRPRADADARLVARCCRIKARFVSADERESGRRAALNFGHTLGHALEGDGRNGLLHGEAVALGMRAACDIAARIGVARDASQGDRLASLLHGLGLPLHAPRALSHATLRRAWRRDKKARRGVPRFVLTPRIGAVSVGHRVPEELIFQALHVIFETRPASSSRIPSKANSRNFRRAEV